MRRNDGDAFKGIQCKQIRVAADNVTGAAAYSEFEEFVVLSIAADRNLHIDIDPFSLARQDRNEGLNILLIDVAPQMLSTQNVVEFGENSEGKKELSLLKPQLKSLTGL